ncbi:glycosyltransferase family 4 protein [Clostridium sp.]
MHQKIWLMNHYAADMFRDKAGRHYWFARKLKEKGYDPTVFCANTYHNKLSGIPINNGKYTVKKDNNIPYVFVKTHMSQGNGLGRIRNMLGFYFNLFPTAKKIVKADGKPDVIIASSVHPFTMVAGIQIARKLKVPCICEIRDLWPEAIFSFGKAKETSLLGKILIAGEHWIYRHADALIFTKEGDTDYLKERGWTTEQGGDIELEKCYYINNGVNIEAFHNSIKVDILDDAELENEKFHVVYAGILRPVNDVGKILDCAKILKEEKDIQFLIYGDGNQFDMLRERVRNENIDNVRMKGFVDRKYIPYVLNHSSVNILNYSQSKYNWSRGNSSNKLFEYMASGKPVISTVKMGYDIIDKYHCGISLEKDSAAYLADAVLRIKQMDKAEYENLCEAAKNAAEHFDFSVLTERLIHVIESV